MPQIGLFLSTDCSISEGGGEGGQGAKRASPGYLNFKSTNVYFYPGSRDRSAFVLRLAYLSISLSLRYRPAFPGRFEFQIPRADHRVGRRGNNRLSSVSTRLCAVICFRRPTPLLRHRYT